MKKQFFRVKQLADQTFLKAEKSEVLNHEELQIADQRVDALRSALGSINKKLCPNGPISDKEKRLRKCLEYQLGVTFVEEAGDEKDCLLFQHILKESGRVEQDLAKEYAEHESKVEEMVYTPLQKVMDNELQNIHKQKHNLKKYCLDRDSATNRYNATKKETLKDDMEEADAKVEQHRDIMATEMFNLLARENEISSYILQLLKLQRGYHESALESLQRIIPALEKQIGGSQVKKVFAVPLAEHLRVTNKRLAYPLEICITSLSEVGMMEEGLFRIAGSLSKVKRLKAAIDSGCFSVLIPEYRDVHVLASTLKTYLRELPEPLLTFHLYKDWVQSMHYPENERIPIVRHLLDKLPKENRDNLGYLIQFLARLAQHPENKMTTSNIAIVMSPNLVWEQHEESMNVNMGNCAYTNMLIELFIKEVDTFFPDNVSRYCSIASLIPEEDLPKNNGKSSIEQVDATSMDSLADSPKANRRKKKLAAPVPPSGTSARFSHDLDHMSISYPSGSATLSRPPKPRDTPSKSKVTVGVGTDNATPNLSRKRSFSKDDIQSLAHQKASNMDSSASTRIVTQQVTNVAKAQPVVRLVPQNVDDEKNFRTTAVHSVGHSGEGATNSSPKPVAAPRPSLLAEDRNVSVSRNSSMRSSGGDVANNFGDVQLRKPEVLEKPIKPEIPARPASLAPVKRSSVDIDPLVQRTQCSVYSVANKQQPSIVNIQNRNEKIQLGHDVMMAEKEKFLGHQPVPRQSLENKFNDINANKDKSRPTSLENKPSVPAKSLTITKSTENLDQVPYQDKEDKLSSLDASVLSNQDVLMSKSSEKLNEINENRRGKPSHVRTRSDGNIMELGQKDMFLHHTPPSPRSLSKPTEPPPPPPVVVKKPEPESTDF